MKSAADVTVPKALVFLVMLLMEVVPFSPSCQNSKSGERATEAVPTQWQAAWGNEVCWGGGEGGRGGEMLLVLFSSLFQSAIKDCMIVVFSYSLYCQCRQRNDSVTQLTGWRPGQTQRSPSPTGATDLPASSVALTVSLSLLFQRSSFLFIFYAQPNHVLIWDQKQKSYIPNPFCLTLILSDQTTDDNMVMVMVVSRTENIAGAFYWVLACHYTAKPLETLASSAVESANPTPTPPPFFPHYVKDHTVSTPRSAHRQSRQWRSLCWQPRVIKDSLFPPGASHNKTWLHVLPAAGIFVPSLPAEPFFPLNAL